MLYFKNRERGGESIKIGREEGKRDPRFYFACVQRIYAPPPSSSYTFTYFFRKRKPWGRKNYPPLPIHYYSTFLCSLDEKSVVATARNRNPPSSLSPSPSPQASGSGKIGNGKGGRKKPFFLSDQILVSTAFSLVLFILTLASRSKIDTLTNNI